MTGAREAVVFGLGLIGGSLARDLAARGVRVHGYDRDPAARAGAAAAGLAVLAGPEDGAVEAADLLALAVPVTAAGALLAAVARRLRPDCLVMDLGSTQRSIAAAAAGLGIDDRFVGAHPLAGDHRSGWAASRPGLFAAARVYLCPTERTAPALLGRARELWRLLGARPEEISAEAHDELLAWTSHLPQLASTALALALGDHRLRPADLGPGGRDATRLAGSSPEMWSAICAENADLLAPALRALEQRLAALRAALERGDAEVVRRALEEGRGWSEG